MSLRNVGGQFGADPVECQIDLGGDGGHSDGGRECNYGDDKNVFNQILTGFIPEDAVV